MSRTDLWAGLALGYLVVGFLIWRTFFRRADPTPATLPMPPASAEDLQVAAEVIVEAGEREQGAITDAAKDPRAAAALAKLRRGKR